MAKRRNNVAGDYYGYRDDFRNDFGNRCRRDNHNDGIQQDNAQVNDINQGSFETIEVRDSCNVHVRTSDTQVGVSLQAAIQVAIAIVINISIADGDRAESVTHELLQRTGIDQVNRQHIVIEGSQDVEVQTRDTDVAVSLQVLLQILFALLIQLDIL